jgi:hypothetical protein
MNGKLIQNHDATVISFMSLLRGVFISIFYTKINLPQILSFNNWALMLILASICTAYAFTASVKVMKEPLYGHVDYQPRTGLWNYFGVFYYWWKRKMSFSFMSEP